MSIEAGSQYIPEGSKAKEAFSVVNQWHFNSSKTKESLLALPKEALERIASDYLVAAMSYLSLKTSHPYLQETVARAFESFSTEATAVILTDDLSSIVTTAIALGVPAHQAFSLSSKNSEPHVLFMSQEVEKEKHELAYVLLPIDFVLKARNTPIEALATTAWLASKVADKENGRLYIDPEYIEPRALATEAQFLLEAKKQDLKLRLTPFYRKVLARYPQGIDSLPLKMRYQPPHHGPSSKTNHN